VPAGFVVPKFTVTATAEAVPSMATSVGGSSPNAAKLSAESSPAGISRDGSLTLRNFSAVSTWEASSVGAAPSTPSIVHPPSWRRNVTLSAPERMSTRSISFSAMARRPLGEDNSLLRSSGHCPEKTKARRSNSSTVTASGIFHRAAARIAAAPVNAASTTSRRQKVPC
jgi:hypothetical protein